MVPPALRTWFVVHFLADLLFAIPLLLAPQALLELLGWPAIDPISARLVGAALMGIGVQSLLGRGESAEVFRAMLNLKIIWSGTASVGILVSMLQGGPTMGWAFLGTFVAFNALWVYYRRVVSA